MTQLMPKSSSDTKLDELESENGANDAIFSELNGSGDVSSTPSENFLQIEGKIVRNEAVFAPKLTIDNLEGETGQIEAVHAPAFSEAATVQHLHDSTVTIANTEGKMTQLRSPQIITKMANSVPKMVRTDFCHKIALELVILVAKAAFQANFCHKTQKIANLQRWTSVHGKQGRKEENQESFPTLQTQTFVETYNSELSACPPKVLANRTKPTLSFNNSPARQAQDFFYPAPQTNSRQPTLFHVVVWRRQRRSCGATHWWRNVKRPLLLTFFSFVPLLLCLFRWRCPLLLRLLQLPALPARPVEVFEGASLEQGQAALLVKWAGGPWSLEPSVFLSDFVTSGPKFQFQTRNWLNFELGPNPLILMPIWFDSDPQCNFRDRIRNL